MAEKDNNNKPNNSRDEAPRKKRKKKNIYFTILKLFIIASLLVIFVAGGLVAGWVIGIIKNAEPINPRDMLSELIQVSYIVDQEGNIIEKIHNPYSETRTIVEFGKMPDHLKNAFIAIEDERFEKHSGVDFRRVAGVFIRDVQLKSKAQGASTITMQLARNIYLHPRKEMERKITEAYYAFIIENQLSKEQILMAYLNTIFLGHDAYGVQEAAQYYFAKDVEELTLAESAIIAGLNASPNNYSPYVNFDFARRRQELVLSKMLELGMINETEYINAKDEEIVLEKGQRAVAGISSYFADQVIEDVISELVSSKGYTRQEAASMLYNKGLRIFSTMDVDMQKSVQEVFDSIASDSPYRVLPAGYVERVDSIHGVIQPQASMVIIDYRTGHIKALMGGRGTDNSRKKLNRATQSLRSPGSAIKPLAVYLPLIDRGGTAATVFDDSPTYLNGDLWPRNWYDESSKGNFAVGYKGLHTVREAMNWSVNTIAVNVFRQVGIDVGVDYAKRLGLKNILTEQINTPRGLAWDLEPSTALGGLTRGVTNLEMTTAYSTLANKGVYIEPVTFTKVTDSKGNIILEKAQEKRRILSEDTAYVMTDILTTVTGPQSATARGAGLPLEKLGIPVAGKTGTTSDSWDVWFVGYTPYYAAGVWIGNDDNVDMKITSGPPSRLFGYVMGKIHEEKGLQPRKFEPTPNIVSAVICTKSGKLATDLCRQDPREIEKPGSIVRTEIFTQQTLPTEYCDVHVVVDVCTINYHLMNGGGLMLATPNCPPSIIERKVMINRPFTYQVGPQGQAPTDRIYDAPQQPCNIHSYSSPLDNVIVVPGDNDNDEDNNGN